LIKERKERNDAERRSGSELLEEDEDETKAMLRKYGLTHICILTVYRWLKKLGFSYEPRVFYQWLQERSNSCIQIKVHSYLLSV
jgi:hypothetical protein